jgi:hypothetical protein
MGLLLWAIAVRLRAKEKEVRNSGNIFAATIEKSKEPYAGKIPKTNKL